MKLNKLSITWNNYTFENEGIPPQSYGGKVVFKDENNNYTQITLSPGAVDSIMQTVAREVAENAKRMLEGMTLGAISDSARYKAFAKDSVIEEGQFVEHKDNQVQF